MRPLLMLTLLSAWLAAAGSAGASDGVLEINQTCAMSTSGCFLGDASGFPVEVSQPGSYVLTSDLAPGLLTGIAVNVANASIDLNGFAIRGSYASGTCGIAGHGVFSNSRGVSVRNGAVSALASWGVHLAGEASRIERVVASGNCSTGLGVIGPGGLLSQSLARSNGGGGFALGDDSVASQLVATANTGIGILAASGVQISDSVATGNSATGIEASDGGAIARSLANGNAVGILATGALVVASHANSNSGVGIAARAVEGNLTSNNGGPGISATHRLGCNVENDVLSCP